MMLRAIFLAAVLPVAALSGVVLCGAARAEPAARVVSLGGAITEIVVALGAQDRLVGRDTTSTYPASLAALPDVGYIRALSAEGVLGLGPGLVLSDAGAGPAEAVEALRAAGVPFVEMPGEHTPDGVLARITAVAEALEMRSQGEILRAQVEAGLASAMALAAGVADRQSVLFVLSLQGGRVMAGGEGTSAEGIIGLAGASNAATGFRGWKQITDEAVIAAAPDVILMMDREGDLAVTDADVLTHPALSQTPAARAGRILRMDGMLMLGFGPRTPGAATVLHRAIYGG